MKDMGAGTGKFDFELPCEPSMPASAHFRAEASFEFVTRSAVPDGRHLVLR
jgi:hypothetical protein